MIIIGEKINASLSEIRTVVEKRDEIGLLEQARMQAAAGADFIDVNVGTGMGTPDDEILSMQWAIETIQDQIETPICVDSADPEVLEAGLRARHGRQTLINSTKAEREHLGQVVPLAREYKSLLVGLAMDESGIPKTVEERLMACEKIASACESHDVSLEDVYFDPLVLPVSTDVTQALVTLNTLSEIKSRFPGAKTAMGLSNVSYGLPERSRLNRAFLHMAIYAGLDAAIMDPLDEGLMLSVKTGEALTGKDRFCRRYTRVFRK